MILAGIVFLLSYGRTLAAGRRGFRNPVSFNARTLLPSAPVNLMIINIRCTYAQRLPTARSQGGRLSWLRLGRGRRAVLYAVGDLPADRDARGRSGHGAPGAPSARGQPDGGRADAAGTRRGDPRAPGGRRRGANGDRGPARRAAADGLLPD